MWVGEEEGLLGYSTISERDEGALALDTFSLQDTTYTVTNIVYNRPGETRIIGTSASIFSFSPAGTERLMLQLGDRWLNLADARVNDRQFLWYGIELTWQHG